MDEMNKPEQSEQRSETFNDKCGQISSVIGDSAKAFAKNFRDADFNPYLKVKATAKMEIYKNMKQDELLASHEWNTEKECTLASLAVVATGVATSVALLKKRVGRLLK